MARIPFSQSYFGLKLSGSRLAEASWINNGPQPILVIGKDPDAAEQTVSELRALGHVAIWIDASVTALDMIQEVPFAFVIVDVADPSDWATCRRVTRMAACPVAVTTRWLARDGRYRARAFRMGAVAYVCKPCTRSRIRELLRRVQNGERSIELVDGAAFGQQ